MRIKHTSLLCGIISLSTVAFAKNIDKSQHKNNFSIHAQTDDVKPQDIIDKYISAIGGKENIDKIKTIHSVGNANVQGMALPYDAKRMNPNKLAIVVSMQGTVVSKQIFDGTVGYKEQQGNKVDFTPDEIKKYAEAKSLFPQEDYAAGGYTLTLKGTTKVNDKPAYAIEVTSPSGAKSTEYYDSTSYLLIRQDVSTDGVSVTTVFDNYKAVNDVKIPYKLTQTISTDNGDMVIDIVADTVTVNANDVAEGDFK